MPTFLRAAVAAALTAAFFATGPAAVAQDAPPAPAPKKAKAKPAKAAAAPAAGKERRPGELEGWESGVKAPLKRNSNRPADAIAEKRLPDGGLPLPEVRTPGLGEAPIGVTSSGNVGGNFKF